MCIVSVVSNAGDVASAITDPVTAYATFSIPHRLTLADAERILLDRNLAVTAAKYQVESGHAAKLIASYKPNQGLWRKRRRAETTSAKSAVLFDQFSESRVPSLIVTAWFRV